MKTVADYKTFIESHAATLSESFQALETVGFPNRSVEHWKYTRLDKLLNNAFEKIMLPTEGLSEQHIDIHRFIHHPFRLLNHALLPNTQILSLGDHQTKTLTLSMDNNCEYVHRYKILVETHASAVLQLNYHSKDDSACLQNIAIDIQLAPGASLSLYKHQNLNQQSFLIEHINVELSKQTHFSSFALDQGAALARSDIDVVFMGKQSNCSLKGFYRLKDRQHIDNQHVIQHKADDCRSDVFYRGIIEDQAHGVFNSKVIVPPDCKQSHIKQLNNNLLLSSHAEINTKPELEIYSDDVTASHGATVGQLDEEALYYLQARGLDQKTAKTMLTAAFTKQVIASITDKPHYLAFLKKVGLDGDAL